ncbi:DNA repair protein RecO [Candidatus Parcubacteria bacterium]|nr:DNA repair protein RecO [Patescibacteria group bacterium]MBU4380808.1 DNA repair protein RecO [Patescibacteria group bacterium]MCG2689473.1 DNA repair protein RecO [Candidatus Parcubacteria bacterium]
MRFFTTTAIVLRRINYSDSDRIYTLLTPDLGKISAIAKGVRKIKSRKAGHLDLGCIVKVSLAEGKNLHILTQAETIQTVEFAKGNLKLANAILEAIESINKALYEGQAGSFYYQLYRDFRDNLSFGESIDNELLSLYKRLIIHLGLWSDSFEGKPLSFLRSYFEDTTESKIRIK